MNPILIDTNAYAAFKRGNVEALAILQHAPQIGVNSIVLGELYSGFAAGKREQDNHRELERFLSLPVVKLVPIDRATAQFYAKVYLDLRQAGTPIPTNDMWIAASALQRGWDLFSYDAHFQLVRGLRVTASLEDFDSA